MVTRDVRNLQQKKAIIGEKKRNTLLSGHLRKISENEVY